AETLAHTFARRRPSPWITGLLAVGMVAWGWLPLSGRFYLRMELPTRAGFGVTPSFFPHGLPTFLEDIGFRGNVLNSNTLGGFLTFHRHPESFPLTDGRWEIYDPGLVQGLLAATRTEGMWRGVAREFDVQGILLAHTSPEARAMLPDLARDENWRLAYLDRAASFWLPAAASKAAAVDPGGVLGTPPGRYEDAVLLAVFFEATGDSDLRVAALRQALPFAWRTTWILEQIGPLLIELQRYAEAEETYHRLVELEPANAGALNELAFLSYVRGDLDRALGYIEEAVRLRPEDQEFRENLRRVTAARSPSGGDPRP
ncbi:MAG TPA: tetratricopeptide repeat protein, partial [Longimicrobiales bacterium]|nr:tetratricopeptide repeat protein [Longimicrobiales bacterium]